MESDEEKLNRLFIESMDELSSIGITIDENIIGKIDIKIARRNCKRYGCCRQENPDKSTKYRKNRVIYYRKYNNHHIEVSRWVLKLKDDIIKNTIIHEIIHCFPDCNNHGKQFKYYARLINDKLEYNISRIGNKEEDYKNSNIEFNFKEKDNNLYKYLIKCKNCNFVYYRKRLVRNFTKKYVCGKCKGRLEIIEAK